MLDVMNKVQIYEIDDEDCEGEGKVLIVSNHWNDEDMVNIQMATVNDDGDITKKDSAMLTVSAEDLRKALDNATNVNRG